VNLSPAEVEEFTAHPVAFARVFIGAHLWSTQNGIAQSVVVNDRTTARACTSAGKTFLAALLALWWVERYTDGIVIVTSSGWPQVEMQFMGGLRKHVAAARRRGFHYPEVMKDRLVLAPERYILGLSPKDESAFGGYHEGHVLVIADEASGLGSHIYAGLEGMMSGGHARLLELGNPFTPEGEFYRHHTDKRSGYHAMRISALDTPNFAFLGPGTEADRTARLLDATDEECEAAVTHPNLTRPRWARDFIKALGVNHARVQSRVFGNFPTDSEHSVIKLAHAEAARDRPVVDKGGPIDIGIDPAGPGKDECAACAVAGEAVLREDATQDADPRGWALAFIRRFNGRVRSVRVDSNGIGYNFALHLADQPDLRGKVVFCKHGNARDDDNFANNTAEDWQGLANIFAEGKIAGVSEATVVQLLGLEWDRPDPRGRQRLKDKHKGGKSPDRAEALRLSRCGPKPVIGAIWLTESDEPEAAKVY
jgi:hypothetical protein